MISIKEAQALPDKTAGVEISGVICYVNKPWLNPNSQKVTQKITVKDATGRIDVTFNKGQPEITKADMGKTIEITGGYMGTYKEFRTMLCNQPYKISGEAAVAAPSQGHQSLPQQPPSEHGAPEAKPNGGFTPIMEDKEYWTTKQRRKDFFFALSYAKDVFVAGLIDLQSVSNLAYNWVCDGYEDDDSTRKPINLTVPSQITPQGVPAITKDVPMSPVGVFKTKISMCLSLDAIKKISDEVVNFTGKITAQDLKEISDMVDAKQAELIRKKLS